jgi:hypothetical protein
MSFDDLSGRPKKTHQASRRDAHISAMIDTLRSIADGSEKDPVGAANRALGRQMLAGQRAKQSGLLNGRPAIRGIQNPDSEAELFRNAEMIADRINLDKGFLEFLYSKSRHVPPMTREAWEREVRIANATHRILANHFKGLHIGKLAQLVDQTAAKESFDKLQGPDGVVLLTSHSGFIKLAAKMFVARFAGADTIKGAVVRLGSDPRDTLFASLRFLQRGGAVFIAPDGPNGKLSLSLNVLGKSFRVGDGAAFLAYTANCNTAWYVAARQGDYFVPVIEPGPKRQPNESFEDFKARLHRFYAEKIESLATGDPRNIVFGRRWQQTLTDSPPAGP